ncbi:unnamed protein product, partial [Didymodactylos carnosus]
RLTRSTLILIPLFGIHYFLFLWNTKPILNWKVLVFHLTVHTIFSSFQGLIIALIYTLINSEVQREICRSVDRFLLYHTPNWQQAAYFRNYINKFDDERIYSFGYQLTNYNRPQQDYLKNSDSSRKSSTNERDHALSSMKNSQCFNTNTDPNIPLINRSTSNIEERT